jgi:hypothetical protein
VFPPPPVIVTEPVWYWPLRVLLVPPAGSLTTEVRMPAPLPVASASSMSPRPAPCAELMPGIVGSSGMGSCRETVVRIPTPSGDVALNPPLLVPPPYARSIVVGRPLGPAAAVVPLLVPGAAVRTCGCSPPSSATAWGSGRTDADAEKVAECTTQPSSGPAVFLCA